jgi:hypothetical protein
LLSSSNAAALPYFQGSAMQVLNNHAVRPDYLVWTSSASKAFRSLIAGFATFEAAVDKEM